MRLCVLVFLFTTQYLLAKPLDLMLGARPQGMGGAFVAIANDGNAAYWNPAGMNQIKKVDLIFSNEMWAGIKGINVNLFNGVLPIKDWGTVGFVWQFINSTLKSGDPDQATYKEDYWREHLLSLTYAHQLIENLAIFRQLSLGINLNIYTYATKEYSDLGWGADLSLFTFLPANLRWGLMVRSLLNRLGEETFPPEIRTGLGYEFNWGQRNSLTLASDLLWKKGIEYKDLSQLKGVGYNLKLFDGLEYAYQFKDDLTAILRSGFNFVCWQDRSEGFPLTLTFGLGLKFRAYRLDYTFKYTTQPEYNIGSAHHLGLGFSL